MNKNNNTVIEKNIYMNEPTCSFYAKEHGYTQLVFVTKKSIKHHFIWAMAFIYFSLLLAFFI
jgi:hypothetical protein